MSEYTIHTCTLCKKESTWDEDWQWFGSYTDLEDGKPIVKTCSDVCRQQAEETGLIHYRLADKPSINPQIFEQLSMC